MSLKPDSILALHQVVHKLKMLPRTGWLLKNANNPESVAAHSFGLALLVMLLAESAGINSSKAIKIALLHDLGESIIGDITPHDGIEVAQKHNDELEAMKQILEEVDDGGELLELWLDFDRQRTPEGTFVWQLDKLEAYLQARHYELSEAAVNEFLASADAALSDPALIELRSQLEKIDTLPA